MPSQDTARILVLISDIQVGQYGHPAKHESTDKICSLAKTIADEVRKANEPLGEERQDFAIFCLGDLASVAKVNEFRRVEEFLLSLGAFLKVPRRRVYICPGNHDYDFGKCDENDRQERFLSYSNFHNNFYSRGITEIEKDMSELFGLLRTRVDGDFQEVLALLEPTVAGRSVSANSPEKMNFFDTDPDLGIQVLSFNSACRCLKEKGQRYGYFPLEAITANFSWPGNYGEHIRIAMGHHNFEPLEVDDTSAIRNPRQLREFLSRNRFRFLFHGHQHAGEINYWSDGGHETIVVGAGSLSADHNELPVGERHSLATVRLDSTFATMKFIEHDRKTGNWQESLYTKRVAIPPRRFTVLRDRKATSKANRDLINLAERAIAQSFIYSNIPSRDAVTDALRQAAQRGENIYVDRVVSGGTQYNLDFAKENLHLRKKYGINVDYFDPKKSDEEVYPFVNFLIVDDDQVLLNFSRADKEVSDCLFVNDRDFASVVNGFLSRYKGEPLNEQRVRLLEEADQRFGPRGEPAAVVRRLKQAFSSEALSLEPVGSSLHYNERVDRVYDVDVLLLARDGFETESWDGILEFAAKESAKLSVPGSLEIAVETRDGPFRPLPKRGSFSVQIHLLLHREQDLTDLPEFFFQGLLRTISNPTDIMELRERDDMRLKVDIRDHDLWSLERLIPYCEKGSFPYFHWGSHEGHLVRSLAQHFVVTDWEKIEFFCYLARLASENLELLYADAYDDTIASLDIEELLDRLSARGLPREIKSDVSTLFRHRQKLRRDGNTRSLPDSKQLKDFQGSTLQLLRKIERMAKAEGVA